MLKNMFILALVTFTYANPTHDFRIFGRDDPLVEPSPTTITVTPSGNPNEIAYHPAFVQGIENPIEGTSFFAISSDCSTDTRNMENSGFANRAAFYTRAYQDATLIASSASDWPLRNTDASDLYFGKAVDGDDAAQFNAAFEANVTENLAMAAHWDDPKWGFDNYIVLTCNDPFQACGGRVGQDPRSVACYVNNTVSWWWNKSYISCCGPFFTTETLDHQANEHKDDGPDNLDLRYLQSSGSFLLHEMVHTLEITQTRPKVIDDIFDGSRGRRIYGPEDVSRAARLYGRRRTYRNADNYAQFASAIYWKKRLGGLPQPTTKAMPPQSYQELITDNDLNYEVEVLATPTLTGGGTLVTCCSESVTGP